MMTASCLLCALLLGELGTTLAWTPGAVIKYRKYELPDVLNRPDSGWVWPESRANLRGFLTRPNTGIALSGGGTLAYSYALGVLRGLHELDLIPKVKYLAGVSGGDWAATAFMYYGRGEQGQAGSDDQFLGSYIPPADLNMTTLNQMSNASMGYAPTSPEYSAAMKHAAGCTFSTACVDQYNEQAARELWNGPHGAPAMLLSAVGVPVGKLPSWDTDTVRAAVERNPGAVHTEDFVIRVDSNRPFFISCSTLLGPSDLMPFNVTQRKAWRIQHTPLYAGIPHHVLNETFSGSLSCSCPDSTISTKGIACTETQSAAGCSTLSAKQSQHTLGGLVDSVAYNSQEPGTTAAVPFGVGSAAGSSSAAFAPNDAMWQPIQVMGGANLTSADQKMNKFTPVQYLEGVDGVASEMAVSDGASTDNTAVIDLVMRGVDKIVAVSINGMFTPLPNSSVWDGSLESPYVNQFAPYICALFGGCAFDDEVSPTVKVAQNHVFESAQFPELVKQLQIGFNQTGAPIANLIVRTVENTHWGIAAGRKIDFTLLYPAQWKQFESKLPTDTQASIVNGAIACDLSEENNKGLCGNKFPYGMGSFYTTAAQTNLVSQMFTSMVMENEAHFREIFQ